MDQLTFIPQNPGETRNALLVRRDTHILDVHVTAHFLVQSMPWWGFTVNLVGVTVPLANAYFVFLIGARITNEVVHLQFGAFFVNDSALSRILRTLGALEVFQKEGQVVAYQTYAAYAKAVKTAIATASAAQIEALSLRPADFNACEAANMAGAHSWFNQLQWGGDAGIVRDPSGWAASAAAIEYLLGNRLLAAHRLPGQPFDAGLTKLRLLLVTPAAADDEEFADDVASNNAVLAWPAGMAVMPPTAAGARLDLKRRITYMRDPTSENEFSKSLSSMLSVTPAIDAGLDGEQDGLTIISFVKKLAKAFETESEKIHETFLDLEAELQRASCRVYAATCMTHPPTRRWGRKGRRSRAVDTRIS